MIAAEITRALGGQWHRSYGMCSCPVPGHGKGSGDRRPSLKVSDGVGGITVHCFGACDWRHVKDALRGRGLLPEWRQGADGHGSRRTARNPQPKQQPDHQTGQTNMLKGSASHATTLD